MILQIRYIGVRSVMVKFFVIGLTLALIILPFIAALTKFYIGDWHISVVAFVFGYYMVLSVLSGIAWAVIGGAAAGVYNLTCRLWGGGIQIVLGKVPQHYRDPFEGVE